MAKPTITRVLVANRGEIARRVFATCRRLGMGTVAVHSDVDADALFVADADVAVSLGGATPAESYLRGAAIIDAARRAGADAVHPGYGFLAENAAFAQEVLDAGLIWIGPTPDAIQAMGSKTEARARMAAAGVPILPGVHLDGEAGDALRKAAAGVGYPLLVKASAGGGGKGMRLVAAPEQLEAAVAAARREAASAFGDDAVFLERFAQRSRHVEIQIIGDAHGCLASLHERDCSVQRRHQKVIEESPSPVVDEALRNQMREAAVAAGEALGYVGAGTVEFLLVTGAHPPEFFFLEVNTRLQVEHPVTELVTGLDLVELQLLVAEGRSLPSKVTKAELNGHAIEARLYAENPANDFLPVTGTLDRFRVPDGVRVDTGIGDGSVISPYYDPMIAKVIAHGATRDEAARQLADALARSEIHGLTTNRDFLVRVLRHPEFLAGDADTAFLERHPVAELAAPLIDADGRRLAALAAALSGQAARRRAAGPLRTLPSGWRNNPSDLQRVAFATPHSDEIAVGYRFGRHGSPVAAEVDGTPLEEFELRRCDADVVELEVDAIRRRYAIRRGVDGAIHLNTADGQVDLVELPRFPDASAQAPPGSLKSPMPGCVIRVLVEPSADVQAGQPVLVIEAMKMEHEIVAPADGMLAELRVAEGSQVDAGEILAVVDQPTNERSSS